MSTIPAPRAAAPPAESPARWRAALDGLLGRVSAPSVPVELLATIAGRFAREDIAMGDYRRGGLLQWCEGVALVSAHRASFADHWDRHNETVLTGDGPLWVVLGDSAAQGLGASHPGGGYVSLARAELERRTGAPWRVLNLSRSGATITDVLRDQLPRLDALPVTPDLVSCGVGVNDLFRYTLPKIQSLFRTLVHALPDGAVMLDMPLPVNRWRIGRVAAPYVARANTGIYGPAAARRLPVAYVSRHFAPPWAGKFGPDDFHPNEAGYRLWSRALLEAIPWVDARSLPRAA